MTQAVLTAEQSKAARAFAGLSQARVAKETGINRSQLALFEVGRYLLPDQTAQALRHYYEEQGYPFDGADEAQDEDLSTSGHHPETDHTRVRGVKTPSYTVTAARNTLERAEPPYAEINTNDEKIAQLAAEGARQTLFDLLGDGYCTDKRDDLLLLMARNYALIRKQQGHEAVSLAVTQGSKGRSKTNGDLVNELFHKKFDRKETRSEPGSSWLL